MSAFTLIVLALIAVGAIFLIASRRRGHGDEQGLPRQLIGAELVYAERTFRSMQWSLVARLDRAYWTPDGLVLVELKTRNQERVFLTDVIEMSVQRVALQDETGEKVSSAAWVLIERAGQRRRAIPVTLKSIGEIVALRARHASLMKGNVLRPEPARSIKQCANCGHRARCSAQFRDRE